MDYKDYTLEDFLSDDAFLQWVKHPDEENQAFWTNWLDQHPEKKQVMEEARELVLAMQFENAQIADEKIGKMQANIHDRIAKPRQIPLSAKRQTYWQYWVAASFFLALVGSVLFFYFNTQTTQWVTDYGDTKTISLPDGSQVTLNANSKISYDDDWKAGVREVFLEGEAFFEVKKLASTQEGKYRKFVVHSGALDVEVLGTTFNVFHRHGATEVVLETGKVKVVDTAQAEIMMLPGERVKFNQNEFTKELVNPEEFIAWKDNQLVFKETPLSKIIQLLEDNYNYEVTLQDEELAKMKFIGTFPADDISILLQTIGKSVQVEKDRKKLVFSIKK